LLGCHGRDDRNGHASGKLATTLRWACAHHQHAESARKVGTPLINRVADAAVARQSWRAPTWSRTGGVRRADRVPDRRSRDRAVPPARREGAVDVERDHGWHMATLARLAAADPALLSATPCQEVVLGDDDSERAGVAWWTALTAAGGEGMVVKPLSWLARGSRGLAQPAIKCRGREYLRIIYGPEYTLPEHLDRLRARNVKAKRSLALREYALGLEALHRFVERDPLYRVHECVFAVLALESEPVDPRL
jgi:hypothetical protein